MRRILVDQFRSNRAAKHGGLAQQLSFEEAIGVSNESDVDLQLHKNIAYNMDCTQQTGVLT
jgi:hypothetical protein